jgi:hypothetical protein
VVALRRLRPIVAPASENDERHENHGQAAHGNLVLQSKGRAKEKAEKR